jgi:hypothetical protein
MNKAIPDAVIPDEIILNQIYHLRGLKVMLDIDLSKLYGVETRRLNEQVKRNKERFPEDFMFQLTQNEVEILMSQFATSSWGGIRKFPYAFTEHGVLMLSSVLNSPKAIQVNIQIMRIFTNFRKLLYDNTELRLEIETIKKTLKNHNENIEVVFRYLDELLEKKEKPVSRKQIGYKLPEKNKG